MKRIIKQMIRSLRAIPYLGKGRHCPVCGKQSRMFRPFGATGTTPRTEVECVHCGSFERHRLLWLFFQGTDLFNGSPKKMLHVAPEVCFEQRFKASVDGYLSADLYGPAMVKMDITDIQYPSQSFDVIYCSHVLEHVVDDLKAMSEFHRVLKNSGYAILLVPIGAEQTYEDASITSPEARLRAFGQADHVRIYGLDYIDRLKSVGFHVETITTGDLVQGHRATELGLANHKANGEIFYCTKL